MGCLFPQPKSLITSTKYVLDLQPAFLAFSLPDRKGEKPVPLLEENHRFLSPEIRYSKPLKEILFKIIFFF